MSSKGRTMSGTPAIEPARTAEGSRLAEARDSAIPWKLWGPYLSERQWGTVREDYSENGDAWNYFNHDQSRSRAYHWGEDGIAGISDELQRLCFALALWNGSDPISTVHRPTSYMKCLYKYPQGEYPYRDLVETNRRRSRNETEYELLAQAFSMKTATLMCLWNTPSGHRLTS